MFGKSGIVLFVIALVSLAAAEGATSSSGRPRQSRAADTHMHHSEREDHWTAPKEAAERSNPIPADRASLMRGRKLFRRHCAVCHGNSGKGNGPAGAALTPKPSNLVEMGQEHSAGELAWMIANGRGGMPAWKGTLNESEIWDLVNYIQNLGAVRSH